MALAAAADEMDDLQVVALCEVGFNPFFPGNDTSVEFHGHPISFHPQVFNQAGKRERRIEVARFAIDLEFHIVFEFRR